MTDNILSFEDLESEQQIGALQVGLPRVILEGKDDVFYFNSWFTHLLDALVFVEADDVNRGQGCSAVGEAVRVSIKEHGVPAIGIVDRDNLFRQKDWTTLLTTDDDAFAAIQTDEVITTKLWEVEAYLIDPNALARWIKTNTRHPPASAEAVANVITHTLRECEALLEATPVFAAAHSAEHSVADSWGLNQAHDRLREACETVHDNILAAESATAAKVRALVAQIKTAAPDDPAERLIYLLRYVNTKRLFLRLIAKLQLHPKAHFALSELMSLLDLRPLELELVVEAHAQAYAA